jgi:hypothetical protein
MPWFSRPPVIKGQLDQIPFDASFVGMSRAELEKEVQNLPPEELRAFIQWFETYTARLANDGTQERAIHEGVERMEDIIKGHTAGLTERQFRQAL